MECDCLQIRSVIVCAMKLYPIFLCPVLTMQFRGQKTWERG